MLKHKTVRASIYYFTHSAKRYSRACSVAASGSGIGDIKERESCPAGHPSGFSSRSGNHSDQVSVSCNLSCSFIFTCTNKSEHYDELQTGRRMDRMGLCDVPKCPLLTFERHPIPKCLVLTVSICHQFYQQCLQGWCTQGLLAYGPLLKTQRTP